MTSTKTSTRVMPTTSIVIRPYQPGDKSEVHQVFWSSMISLESARFRALLQAPVVAVSYSTWAIAVVIGACQRQFQLEDDFHQLGFVRTTHAFLCVAVVMAALIFPLIYLRRYLRKGIERFLHMAINTDLGDVEAIYGKGNFGEGIFLVAEQEGGKIVGTVGAEAKGKGVFELRRMSVSSSVRNQGVASRLIVSLEEHVKPKKMYLSCSNIQNAAHALYEKNGFIFVRKFTRHAKLLNRQAFHFREYAKSYDDEDDLS